MNWTWKDCIILVYVLLLGFTIIDVCAELAGLPKLFDQPLMMNWWIKALILVGGLIAFIYRFLFERRHPNQHSPNKSGSAI